ncbi:MAG: hypothetical protein A2Z46_08770 [Nitrospirae bacterium RBG_19FT_COMBO_55_12]|nr:MAG: hypothetical protein A2Z46_08770 [Nitrospirae bacterium RBG_19FT_COMBO_55_12]
MLSIIIFLLSIGMQLAAAVSALLLIRTTGRKLAWILISLAMLLMAGRRLVSFSAFLTAGAKGDPGTSEFIALIISFLMLMGVLRIGEYFQSIHSTETALKEEKSKLEAIIAAIGDGISIQDTNLKVLYQNQIVKNMIGDHIGEYCYAAYERRKHVCERCPVIMSFKDGNVHTEERSSLTDQGTRYVQITASPLKDTTGNIIAGIEVVRDITGRKLAEKQYRDLVNNALVGIYKTNVRGDILYANNALVRMLEFDSPDDMASAGIRARYRDPEVRKVIIEALQKKGSVDNFECELLTKTGKIKHILLSATLDGEILSGMITDITERKLLEAQLIHAQKMEAVGTLTGGIAHDFNNSLTAIIGYGNILKLKMNADDPLRHNVDQILASTERAANLTQSLLVFSRKQQTSLRLINLNETIDRVGKLVKRLLGENIEHTVALTDGELTVMADSSQIEQVLINLATNARDAMPGGGSFMITTKPVELDNEFVRIYGYGKQGSYALITVTDTGAGMDKRTLERIFEPFFTTKDVGKGTGLGLSIVYGIIKQHKGYIDCSSEPGRGSTFKIYLPTVKLKSDINNARAEIPDLLTLTGGAETVLIAEDDAEVRRLIKSLLEDFGYTVIEAEDGDAAVTAFMENRDKIHLLLFDVIMPKKNGQEAYEEIKKVKPDVKCLFTSGYASTVVHEKGVREGDANFISKPVSPPELLRKVREVLNT